MKTSLLLPQLTFSGALLLLASVSPALGSSTVNPAERYQTRETIVHKTITRLDVELNEKTVVCSRADYAVPMLKVLIPGLSDITLLNHQNFGADAPCVTTREACSRLGPHFDFGRAKPEDILQGRPGIETVDVTVTEKKIETIDHVEKTCAVELVEEVETVIRGKKLTHARSSALMERSYDRCLEAGVK